MNQPNIDSKIPKQNYPSVTLHMKLYFLYHNKEEYIQSFIIGSQEI